MKIQEFVNKHKFKDRVTCMKCKDVVFISGDDWSITINEAKERFGKQTFNDPVFVCHKCFKGMINYKESLN